MKRERVRSLICTEEYPMRINCPWCGDRDIEEFVFGGDASPKRPEPDEMEQEVWLSFVFERTNPKGIYQEYWHHEKGCRHWLVAERDTATHEISFVRFAGESEA